MPTYIIRAGDSGPVKIGWAEDVEPRLRALQTAHYETLTVIREVDTWWQSEAQFHERFKQCRLRGEWFLFCDEMLTFVPPVIEAKREQIARVESRALLAEAKGHVDRLAGPRNYDETRMEIIARVAKMTGLPTSRIRAFHYSRSNITIHAFEIDTLRQCVAALPEAGARPGAAEALQLGKMGE